MYSGKKAQHDFPKMMGGGSKAVWNFSKNSSLLEMPSFPNLDEIDDWLHCTALHQKEVILGQSNDDKKDSGPQ